MADDPSDGDYTVGYGRPPRDTRFAKGQSGNPSGRPRRVKSDAPAIPALYPTRHFIKAEARRMVTIREGDKRRDIATTEGVLRALGNKAMQGGTLAARTYLKYQMEEDERAAAEQEERFAFWSDYVREAHAGLAKARQQGRPKPEFLPHPDDIVFDYTNRTIRIKGPADETAAQLARETRSRMLIFLELRHFFNEPKLPPPDHEHSPVYGICTFLYLLNYCLLPPRLRAMSSQEDRAIISRVAGPRRAWTKYLAQACEELGLPFDARQMRTATIDLRDLGMRFIDGGLVLPYRWPGRKKA